MIFDKSCVEEVFSCAMFSRNVLASVLLCLTIGRRFFAHAVEPIPRCCAEGSVLAFRSDFSYQCEKNGRSRDDGSDSVAGLPVCTGAGRFVNQSIEDADFGKIPQTSCVDVLTGLPEGDRTVVLYCSNDENSPGSHRAPSFINVRRCCPRGQRFFTDTRGCLPIDEPDAEIEAISLLKSFSRIDYVFEKRGLPVCDQAVFDYEVNSWDILLNAEKLELTLTASDDVSSISITEENACLDVGSGPGRVVVRACRDLALCRRRPCLRKCCPEDEALRSGACHKLPSNFTVSKWHQTIWEIPRAVENLTVEMLNTTDYGLIFGKPCMFGMYPIFPEEDWHLVPEGGLHVPGYKTYDHHEYCTEMFYNSSVVDDGFYPFVCFEGSPPTHTFSQTRFKVNAVLLWISSAFLLVTFLVYVCLPALKNLHGLTLMCHVGSLFTAYFCLGIVAVATPRSSQLHPDSGDDDEASAFCKFMGYTTFFSFLSAFFWLNVICFDIWWKFGSLRHSERSNTRRRGPTRRFASYCVYAWGLSFVVALVALTSDYFKFLPKSLTPGIGWEACWFRSGPDYYGEILFFIGPISIQLFVNLIFFILTARRCNMVKEEIRRRVMINRTDPRSRGFQADKTKLILNTKLFVVMGVSWVLEVISYYLNHYVSHFEWKEEFFYISDAVNALQGLLIFVLFVLKKKVFQALKRRLGWDSPKHASTGGIHDPFRVKKSASSSTLMTTFVASTAP